jgi:hypothetical protein
VDEEALQAGIRGGLPQALCGGAGNMERMPRSAIIISCRTSQIKEGGVTAGEVRGGSMIQGEKGSLCCGGWRAEGQRAAAGARRAPSAAGGGGLRACASREMSHIRFDADEQERSRSSALTVNFRWS